MPSLIAQWCYFRKMRCCFRGRRTCSLILENHHSVWRSPFFINIHVPRFVCIDIEVSVTCCLLQEFGLGMCVCQKRYIIHLVCNIYIYIYIYKPGMFTNGPGDLGSIPGRVIPKTKKMVLDATLLNTQHYKVRIKGKVEQSRETNINLLGLFNAESILLEEQ